MRTCPLCGVAANRAARFCTACGASLPGASADPPPVNFTLREQQATPTWISALGAGCFVLMLPCLIAIPVSLYSTSTAPPDPVLPGVPLGNLSDGEAPARYPAPAPPAPN